MDTQEHDVKLAGVAETTLWTLYHRALDARDPNTALNDPKAVELADSISFPFESRFGSGNWGQAQGTGLRARCFDTEVRRFLADHPEGTVVSLGEGLETQFWRVDNGSVRWLSVDLPDVAAVRKRLLPDTDRRRTLACSVTDGSWLAEVDDARGLLITAQGVLMYLSPAEAHALIAACADHFPGAALVFDTPPQWVTGRTVRRQWRYPAGYQPPPMPWGMTSAEEEKLRGLPKVAGVRSVRVPRGRGLVCGLLLPALSYVPGLRSRKPLWVTRVDFLADEERPAEADAAQQDQQIRNAPAHPPRKVTVDERASAGNKLHTWTAGAAGEE
ncbi:class I SAM-dependent methyltransferase [Streptomyces sp. Rer75]|uniref:class I SAM-dependent methyltransferase n=1 Tax=unclassified Streptomyces TaxID=2593676 RepID=UPI00211E57EC|nr:class I SAM-dependent methyltransferase [Streptomyces sp. Rer75]